MGHRTPYISRRPCYTQVWEHGGTWLVVEHYMIQSCCDVIIVSLRLALPSRSAWDLLYDRDFNTLSLRRHYNVSRRMFGITISAGLKNDLSLMLSFNWLPVASYRSTIPKRNATHNAQRTTTTKLKTALKKWEPQDSQVVMLVNR